MINIQLQHSFGRYITLNQNIYILHVVDSSSGAN